MSERAGTEAGYEEGARAERRARQRERERRTVIALYSQDTERQTQKTRTKTQLASFLRHSTLSLSLTRSSDSPLPLQKRAIQRRAARSTTHLETYPAVRVCSLSSPTPLSPHTAMPRIQKKSICAHTRRHCIAIGILHPPPAHAATSKGNEEGHTKRGSTARPCKGRRSRTEAHTLHPLHPRAFPLSARASDAVRSRPRRLRGALVAPIRVEALL